LSPTPTPEDDEEYENRCPNYEADQNAHRRNMGEDLIWRTRMQRKEFNLIQHACQLDVREAHLRRLERRCDRREAEVCAARLSGTSRGSGCGSE
jgi:hypothetical protein